MILYTSQILRGLPAAGDEETVMRFIASCNYWQGIKWFHFPCKDGVLEELQEVKLVIGTTAGNSLWYINQLS